MKGCGLSLVALFHSGDGLPVASPHSYKKNLDGIFSFDLQP
jgi:hypothetical protein